MNNPKTNEFIVFYSWQSDLPDESNRRLIREALRAASSRLEETYSEKALHIVLDEATRDMPGSPNIPLTILEKIRSADVFVCDITTINRNAPKGERRVPNPNVVIELGYAIAHLGWGRIVMLFNKAYGIFPHDVPFDIDRHRASPFHFGIPNSGEKQATKKELNPLIDLLFDTLNAIITHSPARPDDMIELKPEEKKRRHDVAVLNSLLSTIHIPSLDLHIEEAPFKIYDRIFYFWENYDKIIRNSLFYLYDFVLRDLVTQIHQYWGESLSYGHQYNSPPGRDVSFFYIPKRLPLRNDQNKDWDAIKVAIAKLAKAMGDFLKYIRENYLEINLEETSRIAWNGYVESEREMIKRLEGRGRQ